MIEDEKGDGHSFGDLHRQSGQRVDYLQEHGSDPCIGMTLPLAGLPDAIDYDFKAATGCAVSFERVRPIARSI